MLLSQNITLDYDFRRGTVTVYNKLQGVATEGLSGDNGDKRSKKCVVLSRVIFLICVSNKLHVSKCNVHISDFNSTEISEGLSLSIFFFWQYTSFGFTEFPVPLPPTPPTLPYLLFPYSLEINCSLSISSILSVFLSQHFPLGGYSYSHDVCSHLYTDQSNSMSLVQTYFLSNFSKSLPGYLSGTSIPTYSKQNFIQLHFPSPIEPHKTLFLFSFSVS